MQNVESLCQFVDCSPSFDALTGLEGYEVDFSVQVSDFAAYKKALCPSYTEAAAYGQRASSFQDDLGS